MNRKTLIIILSVVGVLCLCGVIAGIILVTQAANLVGRMVSTDPAKAGDVAQSITEYTLPSSYEESFSVNLMGISMAGFSSSDNGTVIMLFQFPPNSGLTMEQMEQQMQQMGSQQFQYGQNLNMEKVGTLPTQIRGEPAELSIYEGSTENGARIRELIGVFEGKNGTAFLMVMGDINRWDQRSIDAFIASMH